MKNKKICGIYCIENNINHKKYIGQSINIKGRWANHKNELNKNIHANTYLQNSWNRNGEENFNFYILEECDENLLDDKERYYISTLHTLVNENGYNLDFGGKLNKHHSDETKEKMSKSNSGKYPSEETRKKISENRKNKTCGENHYLWGKHLSEEHIEKIREGHKKSPKRNFPQSKKVICINTLEIFDTIRQAAKKYNLNEENVSKCCHGRRNYCGKFEDGTFIQWAFYDEDKEYKLRDDLKKKGNQRFVNQYDLNMALLHSYKSIKEASESTNINRQSISKVCGGKYSQTHGFIFKYA